MNFTLPEFWAGLTLGLILGALGMILGDAIDHLRARRGTATGMPATWAGYWLGRLLCKLNLHHVLVSSRRRPTWRGTLVERHCIRDCEWSDERWDVP